MARIIQCPGCTAKLSVEDDAIGRKLACPKCDHQFTVAGIQTPEPPTAIPVGEPVGESVDEGDLDSFFDGPANPYHQPTLQTAGAGFAVGAESLNLKPGDIKRIEAIISDARMVAVAILLCLVCSGCGVIIIGPWYFARLMQWNRWASECPGLVDGAAEFGSLPQRFQAARGRLIVGLVVGGIMLLLSSFVIFAAFVVG